MPFQFVNATPDDIEYSPETRRRIRSQAMRDYRRRQRNDDNGIESSSEQSPPSSIASPSLSSQSLSREDSRQRHSSLQSLSVEPGLLRRHSSGTSSDRPPSDHRISARGSKRASPQSPAEGEGSQSSHQRRRTNDESRAQHGVSGRFLIDLPQRPAPQTLREDMEALASPGQLEQMLTACDGYSAWLASGIPGDRAGVGDIAPCDHNTSRMLLSALALQSIGHLEAIRPGSAMLEKDLLKTSVLALLNERLKDADKALEDNTIGALACLSSYEMSQGSSEATVHLSGLQQILRLRSGTASIGDTAGLPMLLEVLDLSHAVYFHTSPMYTSAGHSSAGATDSTFASTAFPRSGQRQPDRGMLDDISNYVLSIRETAQTAEDRFCAGVNSESAVHSASVETTEQWHRYFLDAGYDVASLSTSSALPLVCRLAASVQLLTTGVSQPHPMQTQAETEELFEAVSSVPDETWDPFTELHTRVLLTALATAADPTSKAWYFAHLTRRLYHTSSEDWTNVKALLMRFVEMQTAMRGREPLTSRAVKTTVQDALGVEIVVIESTA